MKDLYIRQGAYGRIKSLSQAAHGISHDVWLEACF